MNDLIKSISIDSFLTTNSVGTTKGGTINPLLFNSLQICSLIILACLIPTFANFCMSLGLLYFCTPISGIPHSSKAFLISSFQYFFNSCIISHNLFF